MYHRLDMARENNDRRPWISFCSQRILLKNEFSFMELVTKNSTYQLHILYFLPNTRIIWVI